MNWKTKPGHLTIPHTHPAAAPGVCGGPVIDPPEATGFYFFFSKLGRRSTKRKGKNTDRRLGERTHETVSCHKLHTSLLTQNSKVTGPLLIPSQTPPESSSCTFLSTSVTPTPPEPGWAHGKTSFFRFYSAHAFYNGKKGSLFLSPIMPPTSSWSHCI